MPSFLLQAPHTVGFSAVRLLILLLTLVLSACASSPDEGLNTNKWSVKKLYSEAKESLNDGNYDRAITLYEDLESRYPFGPYAEQAQLDIAYAYLKSNEPDTAVTSADRFIKLHPRHTNVDYAYYLRGLARSSEKESLTDKFLPFGERDGSQHDPSSSREAYGYFEELVKKFPDSRYFADATNRMHLLRDSLAKHEIFVAHYYLQRSAYVAAVNRAKFVIENFPGTASSRQALEIIIQGYTALGMETLAEDARRVLELNPPLAVEN